MIANTIRRLLLPTSGWDRSDVTGGERDHGEIAWEGCLHGSKRCKTLRPCAFVVPKPYDHFLMSIE